MMNLMLLETGAICKLRGQFIAPTETKEGKTPLHLILTCDNEPGMRRALEMINEVKNRDKPPELIQKMDGQKLDFIQIGEEIDIDMHGIDKNFNLLEKLKGKDNTYISHIEKKITFQLKLEVLDLALKNNSLERKLQDQCLCMLLGQLAIRSKTQKNKRNR